jgi:hypothetical protein
MVPLHVIRRTDSKTSVHGTRSVEAVSCGVPFKGGLLTDEYGCSVVDASGAVVSSQHAALAHWPDGSIRWLLVEFVIPAGTSGAGYALDLSARQARPTSRVAWERQGAIDLVANAVTARLRPGATVELARGGRSAGRLAVEVVDDRGRVESVTLAEPSVESNGPLRASAVMHGTARAGGGEIRVSLRLSAFAANGLLRFDFTVHNPRRAHHPGNFWELGDAGSIPFKSIRVVLTPAAPVERCVVAESPGAWVESHIPFEIHQESSGGEYWDSKVHMDRTLAVPMRARGYRVTSGGHSREGLRTQPVVQVVSGGESWLVSLLNFWEEFPSRLEVSGADVIISPFPELPHGLHELQGGERKTRSFILAIGDEAPARAVVTQALQPPLVRCDPAHIADSGALLFFDAAADPRHQRLIQEGLDGARSFLWKRERQDEYGWRHFGDIYADHETRFVGDGQLVSHYNNQYDAVAGFAFQFLRSGDDRWWRLMDDLARHVVDIDIYHTAGDKAAYNGGLFWHTCHYIDAGPSTHRAYPRGEGLSGGGPAAEHNYNAGLALHYYLTGSFASREAALSLARWVLTMDDGDKTPLRWLSRQPTGFATASGSSTYHGPGRAGGNSINALMVGFELSGQRLFLDKAEELIFRCIHPADDLAALDLLDAERRWYYTVFLEAVGRYLFVKSCLNELDSRYEYARRSLLHYARWMRTHEYPYLDKPEVLEFPNETWSAQDMRKSEILALAALCEIGAERDALLDASQRFFDDVLTRLPSMPTHAYTRPTVLLLGRGYALPWIRSHSDVQLPADLTTTDLPPRSRFEPQRVVAMRRAAILAAATVAAAIIALLQLW